MTDTCSPPAIPQSLSACGHAQAGAFRNPHSFSVEYEPRLVEEAVLGAVEHRKAPGFRGERNRLYEISDPEEREAAFRKLHADRFERLNLGAPICQAVSEQPLIQENTDTCIVARARARREEGADLFVSPGREGTGEAERRSVGIRLDPQRLLDPEDLLAFLRHELFHIADMLDPAFAYEPRLPRAELGPAHERLLQDRYRVLWDVSIDGRLARRGWAPPSIRDRRFQEFAGTFPMLSARVEDTFSFFFAGLSLTHADFVTFATTPQASLVPVSGSESANPQSAIPARRDVGGAGGRNPQSGERCPLCGFPTHAFAPDPDQLPRVVIDRVQTDFPAWSPILGLCRQCADLYHARSVSSVLGS